ncbi:hypothetical protein GCM10009840_05890 [Pseudolysinimonas kribbensis]|uniref:hypothetical protein n=1 Tax=Pseudolysinimonas kribbensis TaxID=433641 RepID=UPI0031D62C2A
MTRAHSIGGSVVSMVRLGVALHDLADPAARVRLRSADAGPSAGGMLALAREIAQGAALLGAGRTAHRVGGAVDAAHALSMVGYAAIRPERGGLAEAARAAAFAVAEWVLA